LGSAVPLMTYITYQITMSCLIHLVSVQANAVQHMDRNLSMENSGTLMPLDLV